MVAVREASAEASPEVLLPGSGFRGPSLVDIWRAPAGPVEPEPEPVVTRLSEVLDGWRAAERALGEHLDGSREEAVLEAEIEVWRAAYQRIFAVRRARQDVVRTDDAWRGPV